MKILIVYYSRTGNTAQMAEAVAKGVEEEGVKAVVKPVGECDVDELADSHGVILGSPTYYGTMAAPIKQFIDESVKYHGQLVGKAGGAFTSCGGPGSGNETTVMAIVQSLLVHGMVVPGSHRGDHYGPIAVGEPDAAAQERCRKHGVRIAQLVKKLA